MTIKEIKAINEIMQRVVEYVPTFTMDGLQFYRIVGPEGHPHYHSDMTIAGMKDWKIIS